MNATGAGCSNGHGFHFGLEVEFLLADAHTFRPLWHPDLLFVQLNEALESISLAGMPLLEGLELEPPHRKLMPYAVEGYHLPNPDLSPFDLLPKGIEIRTPVCDSIAECLDCLQVLYDRLQLALEGLGYRAVALSHHPTETHFSGPQNKRRHDFWQWAMEAMLTYGPDVNVSLPHDLAARLHIEDLFAKVNYYAPALAALTLASPIMGGALWQIRSRIGKSIRTYRRSIIAPALEVHLQERGRLEFKPFETTHRLDDLHGYFLLWLTLLLDEGLRGRASHQSRIYDLGQVAQIGLEADAVRQRAAEVIERAPRVLHRHGFESSALHPFRERLATGRLPADELIEQFQDARSIPALMRRLSRLEPRAAGLTEPHVVANHGA